MENDFIRRPAALSLPEHNVHHANSMPGDARLSSAYARCNFNVFSHNGFHIHHLLLFFYNSLCGETLIAFNHGCSELIYSVKQLSWSDPLQPLQGLPTANF